MICSNSEVGVYRVLVFRLVFSILSGPFFWSVGRLAQEK